MADADLLSRHQTPENVPYASLDCAEAFAGLTEQEKKYAHYMSQASWWGSLICFVQTSPESPALLKLFSKLFSEELSALHASATAAGVSEDDWTRFVQFAGHVLGNEGNYLSFGDSKIVPRMTPAAFRAVVAVSAHAAELLPLVDEWSERIFSLAPEHLALALPGEGVSTYYGEGVTADDVAQCTRFLVARGISAYNTRLFKRGDGTLEVRVASAQGAGEEGEAHEFEGTTVHVVRGDHAVHMARVAEHMRSARAYVANETQGRMLDAYIRCWEGGSIDDHKASQREWVTDRQPAVETNVGFIESYRDPAGLRGEWEGLVAVVNRATSAKFATLVDSAPELLELLPWPREFEKDVFQRPDFTSLEVVTFASSGVPAGINIPNYQDVRVEGFKNVSLENVLKSIDMKEKTTFLNDADDVLFREYMSRAFEVQVGLHELLGHGSGKTFSQASDGSFNFAHGEVTNPITGELVSSYYKPGEDWDAVFGAQSSPMEECRAECVGIVLCVQPRALSIFGYDGQLASTITYTNWLIMARAGLVALEFYTPETQSWRQAHMQARYAILRTMLDAGVAYIDGEGDAMTVGVHREKIAGEGVAAVAQLLLQINVYKATADRAGIAWFRERTSVDEAMLARRVFVLAKKKPRRVFVQAHTSLAADGSVQLHTFDATPEGMIASFQARFGAAPLG